MINKANKSTLESLYADCLILEATNVLEMVSYDFRKSVHSDLWHRIAQINMNDLCEVDKGKLIRIINFVDGLIFLSSKGK